MLTAFAAFRTPDLRRKILSRWRSSPCSASARSSRRPAWMQRRNTCINTLDDSSIYGLINLFSGGALLQLAIFALGIMPYITASIILQLLRS